MPGRFVDVTGITARTCRRLINHTWTEPARDRVLHAKHVQVADLDLHYCRCMFRPNISPSWFQSCSVPWSLPVYICSLKIDSSVPSCHYSMFPYSMLPYSMLSYSMLPIPCFPIPCFPILCFPVPCSPSPCFPIPSFPIQHFPDSMLPYSMLLYSMLPYSLFSYALFFDFVCP